LKDKGRRWQAQNQAIFVIQIQGLGQGIPEQQQVIK